MSSAARTLWSAGNSGAPGCVSAVIPDRSDSAQPTEPCRTHCSHFRLTVKNAVADVVATRACARAYRTAFDPTFDAFAAILTLGRARRPVGSPHPAGA